MSYGIVRGDEVFSQRQFKFPKRLPMEAKGGSWFPMTSQRIMLPEEAGYFGKDSVNQDRVNLTGMGHSSFLQRYAQDGDSGFFFGMKGGAEPLGSPFPLNTMPGDEVRPLDKPIASESTVQPEVITEPSPMPDDASVVGLANSEHNAEPQQRAVYVPPYSHLVKTGFGKDSALYEEPFEIKPYQHKKKNRFSK